MRHRSTHRGTHSRGPNPKTYSGRERAFGQQQAASSGRAAEEGLLAAAGARGPATAGWRGSWDGGHCGAHASRSARCPRHTRGIRPSPQSIEQTFRAGSGGVARGQARPQAFPSPRGRSPSARGQLERGSRRGAAGAAEGRQMRSIFPASAHNLAPGRPITQQDALRGRER